MLPFRAGRRGAHADALECSRQGRKTRIASESHHRVAHPRRFHTYRMPRCPRPFVQPVAKGGEKAAEQANFPEFLKLELPTLSTTKAAVSTVRTG